MILDGISQGLKVLKLWCVLDAARWLFLFDFLFLRRWKNISLSLSFFCKISGNFIIFQGIQVQEYHGNFCKRIPTDVDLPGVCYSLHCYLSKIVNKSLEYSLIPTNLVWDRANSYPWCCPVLSKVCREPMCVTFMYFNASSILQISFLYLILRFI